MQSTRESCLKLRAEIFSHLENNQIKNTDTKDSAEKKVAQKLPGNKPMVFDLEKLCAPQNEEKELKDTAAAFKDLVTLLIKDALEILKPIDAKIIETKLKSNLLPGSIVTLLKELNFILQILCNKEYSPEIVIANLNFVMPSDKSLYNDDILKKLDLLSYVAPLLQLSDLNSDNPIHKFATLGEAQNILMQFFSAIIKIIYPDPNMGGAFLKKLNAQTSLHHLIEQKKQPAEQKKQSVEQKPAPLPQKAQPATLSILSSSASFFYTYTIGLMPNPIAMFYPKLPNK